MQGSGQVTHRGAVQAAGSVGRIELAVLREEAEEAEGQQREQELQEEEQVEGICDTAGIPCPVVIEDQACTRF